MKLTIKAVLLNISEEQTNIIDNMMFVFCTAIRYSFKRLIEGIKISDLEKNVTVKYNLNSRQAKDAIENARQTIRSQEELVKLNYENYCTKISAIEKILNDKDKILSDRKKAALLTKLDKRKRKAQYFKKFIDTKTIPAVTFGTKEMFIRRCKGVISKEEWQGLRNSRIYSRGDKTKKGNPNLRIVIKDGISYLEISTLEKAERNRAVKILVPIYLPQKFSKKTKKINGINYRELLLTHLAKGEAYQVEVIRKEAKYYAHITFEVPKSDVIYTGHNGILGIDTNTDGFALTLIDNKGNYKDSIYLKCGELIYARSNRRKNLCGELSKKVVLIAKAYGTGIAIENLKFKDDKDTKGKFARTKHQFIYSKLLKMLEACAYKEGVEIAKVKPQYSSKIGLYKYCHQYGIDVHNGSALVIARRSYGFKEKVPKILKNKFVLNIDNFNKKSEWGKWSFINKRILKLTGKVGENPRFWIDHRKEILSII